MNSEQDMIHKAFIIFVLGFFAVAPGVWSNTFILEAEDAELHGVRAATSRSGFSGSGYVTSFDQSEDRIIFTFQATAGLWEATIGYATPYGEKGYDLTINGEEAGGMFQGKHTTFIEHNAGKFLLLEGENTIIIGKGWGWFEIDYIKLSTGQAQLPQKPPAALVDANAGDATKALFLYLVDNYGEKTLAGQQSLDDISYIYEKTGKSPAVGVFDLIDYSPSRIEHGADPSGQVESWIDWALDGGGIVSLSWHWNAPTDLINESGKEWWRGFYTNATTFDLSAALADTTSYRYKLLLRDIDAIAAQLRKFQQADVPVLWRPLHEAAGGWFWWGAKGAESYQKLWRLLFDRLMNVHELHNLVWVCTSNDFSWHPGNNVVDVIGLDIYTDPSSAMSSEWEAAQAVFDGAKMVALSESGTMPDVEKNRSFGVRWSWFSIWSGHFIRDIDDALLQKTYHDPDVITLDELPAWREWTLVEAKAKKNHASQLCIFPNPTNGNVQIRFSIDKNSDVALRVYNSVGQKVHEQHWPALQAGEQLYALQTNDWPSGVYLLHVMTGGVPISRKIIITK
jgi:mannan endo-1,4-beta-mannosidase